MDVIKNGTISLASATVTGLDKVKNGTISLVSAATTALIAVVAAVAIVMCVATGLKMLAGDDEEKKVGWKRIKNILIIAVFIMCASGLVSWVLSFY